MAGLRTAFQLTRTGERGLACLRGYDEDDGIEDDDELADS